MNKSPDLPLYRMLAFLAFSLCIFAFVDGLIPQLQMALLGGQVPINGTLTRLSILTIPILGCLIHPKIDLSKLPVSTWLLCIGFLVLDIPHLLLACGMPLKDILLSYSDYYLLLLIGPTLLVFRGSLSKLMMIRCTVILLLVCAVIGIAQSLTGQSILRTESTDGKFEIYSWNFLGDVRAFSLFTSGLGFGLFCAMCGALGIAMSRTSRVKGYLLIAISALACFSTLTRLCYLVFVCACIYSLVLSFGKKANRGLWLPIFFLVLGFATILSGLRSSLSQNATNLQDSASLFMRLDQWTYYLGLILNSSAVDKLFGLGIIYSKENTIPIDNVPLAIVLHIGVIGLIVFGTLMFKMWLYLRREALFTQQPFTIAAASLWSTLLCAGMFNIVLIQLGAVFALAILCKSEKIGTRSSSELSAAHT